MEAVRQQLFDVVEHISPKRIATLLEFALYLRQKDADDFTALVQASESSLAFWDNPIDD